MDYETPKQLGDTLRSVRESQGKTQEQVGADLGFGRGYERIERGERPPDVFEARDLERYFGVDLF